MKPFKVGDLVTLAFPGKDIDYSVAIDYSGVWKIIRRTYWRGSPFLYVVQKLSDDKKTFQSNYKEAFHASWLIHYRQRNRKKGQHAQRNKS